MAWEGLLTSHELGRQREESGSELEPRWQPPDFVNTIVEAIFLLVLQKEKKKLLVRQNR